VDWITNPQTWIALVTLTALEIVLGIDNVIFISILSGKLPPERQGAARTTGLALAVVTRVLLLSMIFVVTKLTSSLFTVLGNEISWRDLVLIGGGLFLLAKSTFEIHATLESAGGHGAAGGRAAVSFTGVVVQILLLDLVFSLDSVITAIGMADQIGVMIAAVILAIGFMLWFARAVSEFVHRHPTVKMLALSFLLLIGVALVADGLDLHIPKGYIYFAMAFSFVVELLNMKMRVRGAKPAPHGTREG
jgi:predicted tellurium resistance membrane protein TerC